MLSSSYCPPFTVRAATTKKYFDQLPNGQSGPNRTIFVDLTQPSFVPRNSTMHNQGLSDVVQFILSTLTNRAAMT